MSRITFTERGFQQYLEWQNTDKRMLKRINELHIYLIEPELHTEHNKRSCCTIVRQLLFCSAFFLERGNDRAFVLFVDELLDFIGFQRLHQRLNLGALLVTGAHSDDVDVG